MPALAPDYPVLELHRAALVGGAAPAELLVLAPAPAARLRWGPRTIG